jgi:hypothetical protein
MKTKLIDMRSIVFSLLLLFAVSNAWATPPSPPLVLSLNWQDVEKLSVTNGYIEIPVSVMASQKTANAAISYAITGKKAFDATSIRESFSAGFEKGKNAQSIRIPISDIKADGVYEVTLRASLKNDAKSAVDSKVIVLRREKGAYFLQNPVDFRNAAQKIKKEKLNKSIENDKSSVDIRLAGDDLMTVNAAQQAGVKKNISPELRLNPAGSDEFKGYYDDESAMTKDDLDPITVKGRIVFRDFEGSLRPLVNGAIYVMDDDVASGDDLVASVCTDWDGRWNLTVNNDDGFLQNGRDIYIRLKLHNSAFSVHDSDGDEYQWVTPVHDDLDEGTVLDFGTLIPSTNNEACQVFNFINRGYTHIVGMGHKDPGYVETRFPGSGTFWSSSSERIQIEADYHDGPDVVLHEYGHALMYYAFGGMDLPGPGGSHSFTDNPQDRGLAWSEGWATGFMLSVLPDGIYNWHEGDTEAAGEWPDSSVQNDYGFNIEACNLANRTGELSEARVAAAISDFFDAHDDSNGGNQNLGRNDVGDLNNACRLSLEELYKETLWGTYFDTFLEYWAALLGNIDDDVNQWIAARNIMYYNWMSEPTSATCVASKVAAKNLQNPVETLKGVRRFRDYFLKPTSFGRDLIQKYYSNSAEIALILLKDAQAERAASRIITEFGRIGNGLGKQAPFTDLWKGNEKFISTDLEADIDVVFAAINASGSAALKAELPALMELKKEYSGLTIREVIAKNEKALKAEKEQKMKAVMMNRRNFKLNEEQRALIDKNMFKPVR